MRTASYATELDGFKNLYCTDEFHREAGSNGLTSLLLTEELVGAFQTLLSTESRYTQRDENSH